MAFGSQLLSRGDTCQPLQLSQNSSTTPHLNRLSPCPLLCPRLSATNPLSSSGRTIPWWKSWTKKYVILCCICGGTAVMLGVVFIIIYFTLHYYTSSLQYFETIPTYAPAVVLIITGLLVMCFARRRNRYAYLIKLAGGCCLVCAVLCVVITVTTTVIHMNRLQTLRECVYTQKSKICTCFAGIGDDEGAARYVFNNTPDCEVVHGSLYTCLRAMFGLSVIGILVCIFSSMLVYQLLSHEKKKMYWEQLEMRRRFYYRQPSSHPLYCNCYDDYGFAAPHDVYHWQPWEVNNDHCWSTRGMAPRMGFGGDDGGSQRSILVGSTGHRASGWNWLPWSRNRNRQRSDALVADDSSRGAVGGDRATEGASAVTNHTDVSGGYDRDRSEIAAAIPESPHLPLYTMHPYWSVETRFGPRRNGRRRRSNDAVFHHLNMTPPSRYQPPFVTDASFVPPLSFSAYGSLSRHMWGPPPPYSQPSSVENVTNRETSTTGPDDRGHSHHYHHHHHHHHHRQTSVSSATGNVGMNGSQELDQTQTLSAVAIDNTEHGEHPPSLETTEQKLLCSQQQPFPDSHLTANNSNFSSEYERNKTCVQTSLTDLQVDFSEKINGSSTVPSQRSHRPHNEVVGSKSTPHIPTKSCAWVTTPESSVYDECREFSIPVKCCIHVQVAMDEEDRMAKANSEQSVFTSTADSCPSSNTDHCSSSSSVSFEADDAETASNFRTSMVVSTTPSTPVNDNAYLVDMVCARSLPNLNLTLSYNPTTDYSLQMSEKTSEVQNIENGHFQSEDNNGNLSMESLQDKMMADDSLSLSNMLNSKSKIYSPGLSESSPTLPLSVPMYFQNNDHGDLMPLDTFFHDSLANYSGTTSGIKSKSLGNLSPSDNIIVTFKSIHV